MLAAMYHNNNDVRIMEIPIPDFSKDELLLKVMACGICGSDVTEWYRVPKAPKVLGHEATGVVYKKGKNVKKYEVGDRVFVSHHVPCDKCQYCLKNHHTACKTLHSTNYYPGGLAQYVRVPKINIEKGIYKLPSDLSFEEGTFIEPLACVIRGQQQTNIKKDESILIIGSGLSGLLHLKLAKLKKVNKIILADVNPYRLKLAKEFGADKVIDATSNLQTKLKEANNGNLADQVIVCAGAKSAALNALNCVDRGGKILFFAVPDPTVHIHFPITNFWRNEITITTSYGASPINLQESLNFLKEKKLNVKPMITHILDISQTAEGFRLVANAENSLKVIIKPNSQ